MHRQSQSNSRTAPLGVVLVATAVLCLVGCNRYSRLPRPLDEASAKLANKYSTGGVDSNGLYNMVPTEILTSYRQALGTTGGAETARSYRNQFISEYIVLGEAYHAVLDDRLRRGRGGVNAALDITGITSAALATIFSDPVTKTALAGISTVAQGTQDTVSKNLFFDQTTEAVIIKMRQLRAEKEITLRTGMLKEVDEYPLEVAIADCVDFLLAGGITEGLSALTAEAEQQRKETDEQLNKLKRTGEPPLTFNKSPEATELRQQLVKALQDTNKRAMFERWLRDNNIQQMPESWMLGATVEELKAAMKLLNGN